MRKFTKVPEANFWDKALDCAEGDIYCSFVDIYCPDRDEYHHCIGEDKDLMFREYLVDEIMDEIASVKHCGKTGYGVEFPLKRDRIKEIMGEYNVQQL